LRVVAVAGQFHDRCFFEKCHGDLLFVMGAAMAAHSYP
jgi:hypothetical protein